jgi:plastocyanin
MSGPRSWLVLASVMVATTSGVPVPVADGVVTIQLADNLRFDPADVTVLVNTTVRWRNAGTAWHTVSAYEDRLPEGAPYFDSSGAESETTARQPPADGYLQPGEIFEVTFPIPGDYHYFCVPHEGAEMKGVVRVVDRLPDPEGSDSAIVIAVGLALAVAVIAAVSLLIRRRHSR